MEDFARSVVFPMLGLMTLGVSLVLRRVLHETVAIRPPSRRRSRVPVGNVVTTVPEFVGVLLGSDQPFTRSDVIPPEDHQGSLVFVQPSAFAEAEQHKIECIVSRAVSDASGGTQVVCVDSEDNCRRMVACSAAGLVKSVRYVLDSDGRLANLFHVHRRIEVMYVTADGRITKRGSEIRGSPVRMMLPQP